MQREAIFVTVNRNGPKSKLGGGPEAADGDFRTIGDEQFSHTRQNAIEAAATGSRPRQEQMILT
jgi:hypothetical protein